MVVTSGARRLENLRRVSSRVVDQDFCLFATLVDLHPSRVLGNWLDIDRRGIDLTALIADRRDGEGLADDEEEEREDFAEGQFDSHQVDEDEEDGDADGDRDMWYDDEDPETWPE
jgi:hypothetical protein